MPKGVHLPRVTVNCAACGTSIDRVASQAARNEKNYCSTACSAVSRRKPVQLKICLWCGKDFNPSRVHKKTVAFCSRSCARNHTGSEKRRIHGLTERKTAKKVLLEERGHRCERCGWDEVAEVIEVHHRDRNIRNNQRENLELLCPNCHSIDHFRAGDGQFGNNLGRKRAEEVLV